MTWWSEAEHEESPNYGYPRGTHGQLLTNVKAVTGGGTFWHSMVGSWEAARDRFLNPSEEASAHFLIRKVGRPLQMVDSWDAAWHAGGTLHDDPLPGGPSLGAVANLYFHGVEFEGGPAGNVSEPLNVNQMAWGLRLCHWLEDEGSWLRRGVYILRETLWEHNWVYPTACPSGRMNWGTIIPLLAGGDDMDAALEAKLKLVMVDPYTDAAGRVWPSQWDFVLAHTNAFDIHRLDWIVGKA